MTRQTQNKGKQNLKKYLIFGIMAAIFVGCMWLIFAPSAKDKEAEAESAGFNPDIPDPRGAVIVGDKKTAYEQEQARLRQEEKMRSLEDYTRMLETEQETPEEKAAREERQLRMAPVPPDYQEQLNAERDRASAGGSRRTSSIDASGSAYADLAASLGSVYEESSVDEEKEQLKQEVEQLREAAASQQTSMDDQLALLERSFELAAQYNNAGAQQAQPAEQPVAATGRKTRVEPVSQVNRSVVSSLSRPMTDAQFIEQYGQPRNFGFNTISAKDEDAGKNTISAVAHGDQTLVDGQTVRLRTTEEMRAGRHIIPRNTVITGIGRITGERLEISLTTIEYDGAIIPVELTAYDSDGQRGIYIPGSMELEAVKEIAGNLGSNLGTTINLNQQSAGEQLLTDLGRGAIQGTSQYISKKARQVKVTLKAGYRMLLLPSDAIQ